MDAAREIENLLYRYAELIDRGDFKSLAQLFRQGEIYAPAHNTVFRGVDEVELIGLALELVRLITKGGECAQKGDS